MYRKPEGLEGTILYDPVCKVFSKIGRLSPSKIWFWCSSLMGSYADALNATEITAMVSLNAIQDWKFTRMYEDGKVLISLVSVKDFLQSEKNPAQSEI